MSKIMRMRIFAGPNGSGKSTLFEEFSTKYKAGVFINADLIEKKLSEKHLVDLNEFGISATQNDFEYFLNSQAGHSLIQKSASEGKPINISVKENFIVNTVKSTHSYEASLAASFIREMIFQTAQSFSFETVMSHESKLHEIRDANNKGYQSYLYFVCTDAPEINVSRVLNRVDKGGHNVSPEKIKARYERTLQHLFPAIQLCYRTFLFDNSGDKITLIGEIYKGEQLTLHTDAQYFPQWFTDYILPKYIE